MFAIQVDANRFDYEIECLTLGLFGLLISPILLKDLSPKATRLLIMAPTLMIILLWLHLLIGLHLLGNLTLVGVRLGELISQLISSSVRSPV